VVLGLGLEARADRGHSSERAKLYAKQGFPR
jgi:hypothetical protein